jgi:hypothetical protein
MMKTIVLQLPLALQFSATTNYKKTLEVGLNIINVASYTMRGNLLLGHITPYVQSKTPNAFLRKTITVFETKILWKLL